LHIKKNKNQIRLFYYYEYIRNHLAIVGTIIIVLIFVVKVNNYGTEKRLIKVFPFEENAGVEQSFIPQDVLLIKSIALKKNIEDYRVSYEFSDPRYQRSIEFLYPIKFSKKSVNYFGSVDEHLGSQCREIERLDSIKLSVCD
jgi:hypothetical protein